MGNNLLNPSQGQEDFFVFFKGVFRRGFRLSQRSHLQAFKNLVSEKSGKLCEKSGKHCEKSVNIG